MATREKPEVGTLALPGGGWSPGPLPILLTLPVGARKGRGPWGPWGPRGPRRPLASLVANARGSLRSRRAGLATDALSLGALGEDRTRGLVTCVPRLGTCKPEGLGCICHGPMVPEPLSTPCSHPVRPLLGGDPGMQARAAPQRGTAPGPPDAFRTEGLPEGIRQRTAPAGEEVPPGQGLIGRVATVRPPGLTRGCPPRGYPHWGKGPRWVLRAQPARGTSLSSSLLCVGTCGRPGAPLTGIPG